MIPLQVSLESLVVADVRHATAWLLHGINGGLVKRAGLLQTELPLELLQSFRIGDNCLQSALLEDIDVAVTLQVLLETNIYKGNKSCRAITFTDLHFKSKEPRGEIQTNQKLKLSLVYFSLDSLLNLQLRQFEVFKVCLLSHNSLFEYSLLQVHVNLFY